MLYGVANRYGSVKRKTTTPRQTTRAFSVFALVLWPLSLSVVAGAFWSSCLGRCKLLLSPSVWVPACPV